jgi:YVTN family beta-propeller protein
MVVGTVLLVGAIFALPTITGQTSPAPTSSQSPNRATATPASLLPVRLPPFALPPIRPAVAVPSPAPPPTGIVVVANQVDQTLALVDAATSSIVKTTQIGIPAGGLRVSPDGRTAWVFSSLPSETDIYLVDLAKGALVRTKRLHDGPSVVAFSRDGTRAFVALEAGNAVSFLNMANLDEIGTIPLGRQTDGFQMRRKIRDLAVVRTVAADELYVAAQGSGVVWVLDAASGMLVAEIETGGGPVALVPDPVTPKIYAVADTLNQLITIDVNQHTIVDRIVLPGRPSAAARAIDGEIWVAGQDLGEVWLVDPATHAVTSRLRVGAQPSGISFSSDGSRAYVTNGGANTLSVFDVGTRQVLSTVRSGAGPAAIGFSLVGRLVETPVPTATSTKPAPTPTLVPSPTPLPDGAPPPQNLPSDTVVETFVPNAAFPTALAFAPDGRVFYNELRTGKIRIVKNGVLQPDPFYQFTVAGEPETGLLGLTLDPSFAQNHYVYVFYTQVDAPGTANGGPHGPNQLVRLTDVGGKGTQLTPILRDLPSNSIHNAGRIRFGPDGKLYVSLGETDHQQLSQDLSSLAGKILRINADGSVPSDNPFVGQRGRRPEIWAYGLRNVFGFDFHPTTGEIFATENGPGDNDEIDLITRGSNYGWPPTGYKDKAGIVDPLGVFNPVLAPTGLAFYTGSQIPQWTNDILYCNYHQGQLRRIHLAPVSFDRIVSEEIVTQGCTVDVESGPDGAVYYSNSSGIYRIRRSSASALPAVRAVQATRGTQTPVFPPGTRAEDQDVDVSLSEWALKPSRKTVPAGQIRFVAENLGAMPHALRIVGKNVDVSTDSLRPGQNTLLEIQLAPGTYTLSCPIENHAQTGMTATLIVVGN